MPQLSLSSLYDTMHALERILGRFPILILALDRDGRVVMSNATARDAFDRAEVDMLETKVGDLIPGLSVQVDLDGAGNPVARISPAGKVMRAVRHGGGAFPIEIQASAEVVGDDVVVFLAIHDLSERLRADKALRESQELLDGVLSGVPAVITAKAPDGRYELVNAYAAEVFGIDAKGSAGKTSAQLLGARIGRAMDAGDRDFIAGRAVSRSFEESLTDAEGRQRRFVTTKAALRDGSGAVKRLLSVSLDVSHRDAAEQRLERLAQVDELTGLPRRPALHRALANQIQRARDAGDRANKRVGFIALAIGNLDEIAAEHGERSRDAVIRRLGIRLCGLVEETAIVARVQTDQFGILLPNVDTADEVQTLADRIAERIAEPVSLGAAAALPAATCGVAVYPESGVETDEILGAATVSLSMQRGDHRLGGANVEGMAERVRQHRARVSALRRDLEHGNLHLSFAPLRVLASGRLHGFRTLATDTSGRPFDQVVENGLSLIQTAEQAQLIGPLGEWVLRQACEALGSWPTKRPSDRMVVSVPLFSPQLHQPDLVDMIGDILAETDTPPASVMLTIDEGAAMDDPELTLGTLSALSETGIRLGIDGFGAGASSLLDLRRLPVDTVILSPKLLEGVPDDPYALAIASAAQSLARTLGKIAWVDGIETDAQARYFQDIECEIGCGPVFGAALDADGAAGLIAKGLPVAV